MFSKSFFKKASHLSWRIWLVFFYSWMFPHSCFGTTQLRLKPREFHARWHEIKWCWRRTLPVALFDLTLPKFVVGHIFLQNKRRYLIYYFKRRSSQFWRYRVDVFKACNVSSRSGNCFDAINASCKKQSTHWTRHATSPTRHWQNKFAGFFLNERKIAFSAFRRTYEFLSCFARVFLSRKYYLYASGSAFAIMFLIIAFTTHTGQKTEQRIPARTISM